jgi:hypothetical protein
MKKIALALYVSLFIFLLSMTASAEFSVKEYKQLKENDVMKTYIEGLGRGFVWANVVMKKETNKSLFCSPEKLALGKDNFIRILDDEIKRQEIDGFIKTQEASIEMVLLFGLKNTFPCMK